MSEIRHRTVSLFGMGHKESPDWSWDIVRGSRGEIIPQSLKKQLPIKVGRVVEILFGKVVITSPTHVFNLRRKLNKTRRRLKGCDHILSPHINIRDVHSDRARNGPCQSVGRSDARLH
jgi:hypothetical protein